VINGTSSGNALVVDASGGLTNQGLVEGTGAAGTSLLNSLVKNTGTLEAAGGSLTVQSSTIRGAGVVEALGSGSHLYLRSGTILGGVVATDVNGVIETLDSNNTIDSASVNNAGVISIDKNTQLILGSTVNNTGSIALRSAGNSTILRIDSRNLTLSGGGHVTLSDNANNYVYGVSGADVLTNVNNTLSGSGQLGYGQLTLINQNTGIINATGVNNTLVLNTPEMVSNAGLVEDTGAAGLEIVDTLVKQASTGVIEARGANAHVDLQSARIVGGVITDVGGGVVQTTDSGVLFDALAISKGTTVTVNNNTALNILGTIKNAGVIALKSVGNATELLVSSLGATLTGGMVTMTDNANNYISGAGGAALVSSAAVTGAGQIGQLAITNQLRGVIDGSGVNGIAVNAARGVVNQGLMEGTSAGGLTFNGGLVNNSGTLEAANGGRLNVSSTVISGQVGGGGMVEALGIGSHIDLQSATLTNGSVRTDIHGVINTLDGGSMIDNAIFDNSGMINIINNTALTVGGSLTNSGMIKLNSTGNGTSLVIDANDLTLTGAGAVMLTDSANNYVYGRAAADTLTNVDNDISGSGQLGDGALTFINGASGIVNGNGAAGLTIDSGLGSIANLGLIEGTGVGGATLASSVVMNTGVIKAAGGQLSISSSTVTGAGTIEALGSGSVVTLASASLSGGALATDANGIIRTADNGSVVDNVAVANAGAIDILNNTALTLGSTVTNSGTIALQSTGNSTSLVIDISGAALQGGGQVTLSNNANNDIYGQAAADTLTNVDNTISGAGALGDGRLTFINGAAGVVNATSTTNALVINTGGPAVSNAGVLEAATGATLTIQDGIANTGSIAANGGTVSVQGMVSGAGSATIGAGGQIEFGAAASCAVGFTGSAGKLILDDSQQFSGSIAGLSPAHAGDVVDLSDISFASATETYAGTTASGVLTISDGSHTATLALVGNFTIGSFAFSADASGHVQFHDPAVAVMVSAMASLRGAGQDDSAPQTASTPRMAMLAAAHG
jgi:hypothetical protein